MTLKKTVALFLTAVFIATCVPAYGDEISQKSAATVDKETENLVRERNYPDVIGTEYESSAINLDSYDIVTGYPDGTFRPHEKITRAEFAAVITRFLSVDHIAKTMESKEMFSDVDKEYWANREISLVCEENIFSGFGDGTFRPMSYITYNQALKVIVEALGYGEIAKAKGGWPTGYQIMVAELGVLESGMGKGDSEITRGEVVQLLEKALTVKMTDGKTPLSKLGDKYFYVSTYGDDANPGTMEKPWKTLSKAAQTALAGTTVIFEDGTYNETRVTTFANSGTEGAPITLKAKNKHKAIIKYAKSLSGSTKMQISSGEYINIRDFYFTQEQQSTSSSSDIYIRSAKGQYCEITGNKFDKIFEEAIKLVWAHFFIIDGNVVIDSNREGMDIFGSGNIIIRNNELYNCGRTGFMIKGNTYNTQLYNNYIVNETVEMMDAAIGLGGSSNNYDPFDVSAGTGFENYCSVAYNNIIISKKKGLIPHGIAFISSKGCRALNNIVVGTTNGIRIHSNDGTTKGWEWDPPVVDPVIQNNIIVDCDYGIRYSTQPLGKFVCESNIFYKVGAGNDVGGKIINPMFEDFENNNFNLKDGSPAIDSGVKIDSEYVGFNNEIVKLELIDYAGKARDKKWDIGIFNAGN